MYIDTYMSATIQTQIFRTIQKKLHMAMMLFMNVQMLNPGTLLALNYHHCLPGFELVRRGLERYHFPVSPNFY
jgi:hypothetical protein